MTVLGSFPGYSHVPPASSASFTWSFPDLVGEEDAEFSAAIASIKGHLSSQDFGET